MPAIDDLFDAFDFHSKPNLQPFTVDSADCKVRLDTPEAGGGYVLVLHGAGA